MLQLNRIVSRLPVGYFRLLMEENRNEEEFGAKDEIKFSLDRFQKSTEESKRRVFYSNQRLDALIYGISLAILVFNTNVLMNKSATVSLSKVVIILLILSLVMALTTIGLNLYAQMVSRDINDRQAKIGDTYIDQILSGEDQSNKIKELKEKQGPKIELNNRLNKFSLFTTVLGVVFVIVAVSLKALNYSQAYSPFENPAQSNEFLVE